MLLLKQGQSKDHAGYKYCYTHTLVSRARGPPKGERLVDRATSACLIIGISLAYSHCLLTACKRVWPHTACSACRLSWIMLSVYYNCIPWSCDQSKLSDWSARFLLPVQAEVALSTRRSLSGGLLARETTHTLNYCRDDSILTRRNQILSYWTCMTSFLKMCCASWTS